MGVHPETLRVWERHGLLKPPRKNTRRLFTGNDLKRLAFIGRLLEKGLNLAGVAYHLSFYPCWLHDDCPTCMRQSTREECSKPCWKEEGSFCRVALGEAGLCERCEHRKGALENEAEERT